MVNSLKYNKIGTSDHLCMKSIFRAFNISVVVYHSSKITSETTFQRGFYSIIPVATSICCSIHQPASPLWHGYSHPWATFFIWNCMLVFWVTMTTCVTVQDSNSSIYQGGQCNWFASEVNKFCTSHCRIVVALKLGVPFTTPCSQFL